MNTREVPQQFRCPDCGMRFYDEPHHREQCDGVGEPIRVCARRTVNASGYRSHCWLPAGHKGPCR